MGPGDAIKQSIDWVKDNFGKVFLILLVAYLVYYVGVLLCCIGVLATGPIALISIIHSYRRSTRSRWSRSRDRDRLRANRPVNVDEGPERAPVARPRVGHPRERVRGRAAGGG